MGKQRNMAIVHSFQHGYKSYWYSWIIRRRRNQCEYAHTGWVGWYDALEGTSVAPRAVAAIRATEHLNYTFIRIRQVWGHTRFTDRIERTIHHKTGYQVLWINGDISRAECIELAKVNPR